MNILEFDSLYLEFEMRRVLSSVYMKCETGKIIGLLGRNGSGKSCLMKIVFGSMSAEHKSIRINGEALIGNYMTRKMISYLPQEGLFPSFVKIKTALDVFEIDLDRLNQTFPELIPLVNLRPDQISTGQLRLFEVLTILFSPRPFSIFDEPFSGLMPLHVERLKEIFQSEKKNKGIIITDHLHREIRSMTDQLYVLVNGKTYLIEDEERLIELGYINSIN